MRGRVLRLYFFQVSKLQPPQARVGAGKAAEQYVNGHRGAGIVDQQGPERAREERRRHACGCLGRGNQ